MAHAGARILKYKDHLIPKDILEKIIQKFPTGWGMALTDGDGEVNVQTLAEKPDIDVVMQAQEALKDKGVLLFFANYPEDFMDDDVQPMIVLWDKNNAPIIAAVLDGDFSEYHQSGSKHSDAFFAASTELMPKLKSAYEMIDGDPTKLMDYLRNPQTQKEIKKIAKDSSASIQLFCVTGDKATVLNIDGDPDHTTKFDWGLISSSAIAAITEPDKVPETVPEKKEEATPPPDTGKQKFSLKPKGTSVPEVKPETKPTATAIPETAGKTKTPTEDDFVLVGPPPVHLTNAQKRTWWQNAIGSVPAEYKKSRVKVEKQYIRDSKLLAGAESATSATEETKPVEAPITKPVETPNETPSSPVPILSQHDKSLLGATFFKAIDTNSQAIPDPAALNERESKYPTFAAQTGKTVDELALYSYETLVRLGKEVSVEALAILAKDALAIVRSKAKKEEAAEQPASGKPKFSLKAKTA